MNIKQLLNTLYDDYDYNERIYFDPIEFPHRFSNPQDIEIVAFISSCFAYGQVPVFKKLLEKVFAITGSNPYDFVASFDFKRHGNLFKGIKYRFNSSIDITCLINTLSLLIKDNTSLKDTFISGYKEQDYNVIPALTVFVEKILTINTSNIYGENVKPIGYKQFFPSPSTGSACKRMNLFLRWMVRDGDVDFGLWREIPKDKLIIPLDTHIARISQCLGLTKRSVADMKMAVEITESLKEFDPKDPVKYDFALCHHGISRVCSPSNCRDCYLKIL